MGIRVLDHLRRRAAAARRPAAPGSLFLLALILAGMSGGCSGSPENPGINQNNSTPSAPAPSTSPVTPPAPAPANPPADESPPPPIPMLAWSVSGTLADAGVIAGSFSYSAGALPDLVNENNLVPNRIYNLAQYSLTITETSTHPALQFSPSNTTASLCVGNCVFGSPPVERLTIKNNSYTLQLVFLLPDGVTLPQTIDQWGPVYLPAAWLKSAAYVILVRTEGIDVGV